MRVIRIYQPGEYTTGQTFELSPEAAQHVAVVLRMQVGAQLILFSGDNKEYSASIEQVKKKQVVVKVHSMVEHNRESSLSIHLGQAISKGDRMEQVMQKATELGVSSITPLITEHCAVKLDKERMQKKVQQWQSIVIAACEQSGRNKVPQVHTPLNLDKFVQTTQSKLNLILHPYCDSTWKDYPIKQTEITLMIGPEGGFSEAEVAQARQHDFLPLSLGPRILRTETAAISALSVLQAVGGDL